MTFHFPAPLYPIIDPELSHCSPVEMAEAVIAAGIRFFQLRVKHEPTRVFVEIARRVQDIAARRHARVIINDRADVAHLVGAAGVHLGRDDLPPLDARALLGPEKLIGLSTHDAEQVAAAVRDGVADYLAFGPIYATRSKEQPDPVQGLTGLSRARARCPLPLVAIGGITSETLGHVLHAGADAVAVIGAIASAADPQAATRTLLAAADSATALRARRRS